MSRLTRDGTAEPVSRDQILRHTRGQGNIKFPCSADHEQDWQPYISICVIFRCVLHPLPLPLSSCLGCIPPLIGLPSLRFYAVGSSLFLLSVCFCLCSLFYRDDVLCWLLLARPFLYAFHAHLRFPVDLVWFRLSCDHGWIRSGSVNVRKQQQQPC